MFLTAKTYKPSYTTLKIYIFVLTSILVIIIIISIILTNRFLTNFIFKRIKKPLEILETGVEQIHDGNLGYRIKYDNDDEFLSVCNAFNEMAIKLKESVEMTLKNEKSRKELFAGISHDLRSPLTSIQAYIEGLIDGIADTPEKQQKYLTTIKQKSESISNMLSQLFTFSKMELDDYPVDISCMDIKKELETIIETIKYEYAQKKLTISTNIKSADIKFDVQLLQRICLNIISNALKYINKEKKELNIYSEISENEYIIHFKDNGSGTDEQSLDKLFEVFYRSDISRNNPDKSSGLGLAIVANAIHKMNGTAKAKNAENGGLDIIITFPMEVKNE